MKCSSEGPNDEPDGPGVLLEVIRKVAKCGMRNSMKDEEEEEQIAQTKQNEFSFECKGKNVNVSHVYITNYIISGSEEALKNLPSPQTVSQPKIKVCDGFVISE